MTSPKKQFHNIEAVKLYCESNYESYCIVSEMGENGDNPHLNVIIKETQRLDNLKRTLMNLYYGKELEQYKKSSGFLFHGAKGKTIRNDLQLKNTCNYLRKETSEYYFFKEIDIHELCKDEISYNEHKSIRDTSTHCNLTLDKLLDLSMEIYMKEYLKLGLNTFILEELPPPSSIDFKEVLKIMSKNKINCMPIYKNLQGFYIQFMAQLGNHEYIDLLVDRLDEKLRKRID